MNYYSMNNPQLKILIIHTHYQYQGGEDTVVLQEMELLKQFNTVEVLSFQNQGGWKGAIQFLMSIWNLRVANKVKKKIQDFKPDIVHVHNWHFATGPILFRLIKKYNIPLVHTVHNYRLVCPSAILYDKGKLFTKSLDQSFPWNAVSNSVYRNSMVQTFWISFIVWFHKKINTWKKIDLYLCLTPFSIAIFQKSNFGVSEDKFVVKPNFTQNLSIPKLVEREKHFLFIGRLSEEKGIETVINAFKNLPFVLKIAGDGPLKALVEKTTKESSNIFYLGNLDKETVGKEMMKAQALIFPSVWYEGMPMTILEAFSRSTPIIASDLGAMTTMISNGYNGFLFESGNVNDLKYCVKKFDALTWNVKEQMGLNSFEKYESNYSPKLQKDYFNSIYKKVIKQNE